MKKDQDEPKDQLVNQLLEMRESITEFAGLIRQGKSAGQAGLQAEEGEAANEEPKIENAAPEEERSATRRNRIGDAVHATDSLPESSAETAHRDIRRRALRDAGGEATWPVQYTFADIIGKSPVLVAAKDLALQVAQGGSSVLLVGESGTGKELFAHAIHAASPRRVLPFVPIDCSAIPHELLEAELFGYAPGSFTGADKQGKPGKFELANGGTIFLDEIGEMPLEMQAKLLRVLQEHRIVRIGGVTIIPVAFAVIAATNRDLATLVSQGRFRRDLLYRLDVIRIEIPSLCERPEDIPLLFKHYWDRKSREFGKAATLSAEALRVVEGYAWPGNIRELLNLVERLLVTVPKSVIETQDLPPHLTRGLPVGRVHFPPFHLPTVLAEVERRTLQQVLRLTQGNRNTLFRCSG